LIHFCFFQHYNIDDHLFSRRSNEHSEIQIAGGCRDARRVPAPQGEAFATINSVENHPVASKAFAHWLTARYLDATGKGPSQKALSESVATLAAKAVVKGTTCKTFYRIAQTSEGIFLDLGDDSWRCIRVTMAGWSVVSLPPVKFIRNCNTAALPEPRPGNIDRLRRLVHVTEPEFHLLVGSILDALKGHGPYFVTILNGEYGSAKSSTARLLQALIDPVQTAPLPDSVRVFLIDVYLVGRDTACAEEVVGVVEGDGSGDDCPCQANDAIIGHDDCKS
jgi:hypothetical protein